MGEVCGQSLEPVACRRQKGRWRPGLERGPHQHWPELWTEWPCIKVASLPRLPGVSLSRVGTSAQTPRAALGTDEVTRRPHVPPAAVWPLLGPLTLRGGWEGPSQPCSEVTVTGRLHGTGHSAAPRCQLMPRFPKCGGGGWAGRGGGAVRGQQQQWMVTPCVPSKATPGGAVPCPSRLVRHQGAASPGRLPISTLSQRSLSPLRGGYSADNPASEHPGCV